MVSFINNLNELHGEEGPFEVLVTPVGMNYTVNVYNGVITCMQSDLVKPLPDTSGMKFPKLTDGINEGIITILRHDLYKARSTLFKNTSNYLFARLIIDQIANHSNCEYLTFFKPETVLLESYEEIIEYISGLVHCGLSIYSIRIDNKEWLATRDDQLRSVTGFTDYLTIFPDGEICNTLALPDGERLPYINDMELTGDTAIYDKASKVLYCATSTYLPRPSMCPCCSSELIKDNNLIYCSNPGCSPHLEAFYASITEQTGITKSKLINDHHKAVGVNYEVLPENPIPIDTFRTLIDTLGIEHLNDAVNYLVDPTENFTIEKTIGLIVDSTGYDEPLSVQRAKPVHEKKVLITGQYSDMSDSTLSMLLHREDYSVTVCLEEALFVIATDDNDEFEDYVRETSNKLILKLSSAELIKLLKK